MLYEIVLNTLIKKEIAAYFYPMTVDHMMDQTYIRGQIKDQAALFGLLAIIRDFNLNLVSINPL